MAKGKKKRTATGVVLLQGTAAAVGVYLAGVLLLALLVVKGVVPERAAFPAVAVLCLLGALSGGGVAARGTPWGPLPAALLNTALFAAVLLVVGLACWPDGVGDPQRCRAELENYITANRQRQCAASLLTHLHLKEDALPPGFPALDTLE